MKHTILVVSPSIPQILKKTPGLKIIHEPLIYLKNLAISAEDQSAISTSTNFLFTSSYSVRRTWFFRKNQPKTMITAYAIGKITAKIIRSYFHTKTIHIPPEETQEGMAIYLKQFPTSTLLWPCSTHARSVLFNLQDSCNYSLKIIPLYTPIERQVSLSLIGIDSVFFGCPSSVTAFFKKFSPQSIPPLRMIPIGPITKNQLLLQGVPHEYIYSFTPSIRNG